MNLCQVGRVESLHVRCDTTKWTTSRLFVSEALGYGGIAWSYQARANYLKPYLVHAPLHAYAHPVCTHSSQAWACAVKLTRPTQASRPVASLRDCAALHAALASCFFLSRLASSPRFSRSTIYESRRGRPGFESCPRQAVVTWLPDRCPSNSYAPRC